MFYRVDDIAQALGAKCVGDLALEVRGVAEPRAAGREDLALAMDPKFAEGLAQGNARVAVLWEGANYADYGLEAAIFAPRSRYALAGLTEKFAKPPLLEKGISPLAFVHETAELDETVDVGPFVYIGPKARISGPAKIHAHCYIAEDVSIAPRAVLYAGVRVGVGVSIGEDFIAQMGATIGTEGFSYVTPKPGGIEEARRHGIISTNTHDSAFVRIHALGSVRLGARVELGGNSVIDAGTISDTVIGDGTKIDNLVHIAHNVTIGRDCLLCGQVGIAGSTEIGDRVVMAGQVGVADHVKVGSDVVIAGKSAVSSHVPSGRVMMGNPAMQMDQNIASYKALRRLPRLLKKLAERDKNS